ncbi:MAG: hypothetical protein MUC59_10565 [Saprospiraceae bacterium]|jgi:hypothetical protein|nr:hypothetical protein [Saprospiraceae bacterium]
MNKMLKNSALAVILLLAQYAFGQKIEHTDQFDDLLRRAGVEVFEPLDAGYRSFEPLENQYLNCHHAISSNSEDLQIRYYVLPWDERNYLSTAPNVATFLTITNLATNADEAIITALRPDSESLRRDFNADWGMTYVFTPKPAFDSSPICKMIALSKEGQGTVFVFFLFDDPANTAIDSREMAVSFKKGSGKSGD